jgi:hypothetical protein
VQYHLAAGGGYLKLIDKDTFEIIKTGQRVRRIS